MGALSARAASTQESANRARAQARHDTVRVVIAAVREPGGIGASTAWRLTDESGREMARGTARDPWSMEWRRRGVRAVGPATLTPWRNGPIALRPADALGSVTWKGRRYRGELTFIATDTGMLVINRVGVEDYLRGVVAREIGPRRPEEHAAVEAQAVAARSFTYTRLAERLTREFDFTSGVLDQVYSGADGESAIADAAVRETAGLVLMYAGRVIIAPYSSTCGGSTAEPPEVWRNAGTPYLKRVSDRIPGTERVWCDISPRYRWERTFDAATLRDAVERYIRAYASVPAGPLGGVRAVTQDGVTPSGRVAAIEIATESGTYRVRGNDMRFVLRSRDGEILASTYFSLEPVVGREGRLTQLTLRGMGNGHGVGMCQWGAIGRSRAGHDFRAILRAYYPGTTVEAL